jgi:hypothetical protein
MDSSTSSTNTPGVDSFDYRDVLYYGKYRYRARITIPGLSWIHGCDTMMDYLKRLDSNRRYYDKNRIAAVELDDIESFIDWRSVNVKTNKTCTIRVESNTAGVFSNDLALLQKLRNLSPTVEISEVIDIAPTGIKTFAKEPKHKYRVYLKSKRIKDTFKQELSEFIKRYQGTKTVIVPSDALRGWLKGGQKYWQQNYCSSHYYIEYDEDSTNSLISLMFGDMIKRRFKLEKRPETT